MSRNYGESFLSMVRGQKRLELQCLRHGFLSFLIISNLLFGLRITLPDCPVQGHIQPSPTLHCLCTPGLDFLTRLTYKIPCQSTLSDGKQHSPSAHILQLHRLRYISPEKHLYRNYPACRCHLMESRNSLLIALRIPLTHSKMVNSS